MQRGMTSFRQVMPRSAVYVPFSFVCCRLITNYIITRLLFGAFAFILFLLDGLSKRKGFLDFLFSSHITGIHIAASQNMAKIFPM